MTTKHTPGPWKAVEEFEGWAVIRSESTSFGKQYIATEINQGHDMGEADAKLIAAAPELLKALQLISKEREAQGYPVHFHWSKELTQAVEYAIIKATDGTN